MNRLARKESEGRGRQSLRGHITALSRPGPRHMTLEDEWFPDLASNWGVVRLTSPATGSDGCDPAL